LGLCEPRLVFADAGAQLLRPAAQLSDQPLPRLASERGPLGHPRPAHDAFLLDRHVRARPRPGAVRLRDIAEAAGLDEPYGVQLALVRVERGGGLTRVIDDDRVCQGAESRLHARGLRGLEIVEVARQQLTAHEVAQGKEVRVEDAAGELEDAGALARVVALLFEFFETTSRLVSLVVERLPGGVQRLRAA